MTGKRVAIVTGANRGIGREIARQLAKAGLVVAVCARDAVQGEEAADAIRREGGDAYAVVLDVDDAASVRAGVDAVLRRSGRIDVLVNNAAVLLDKGGFSGSLFDLDEDVVRRTHETNVLGPLRMILAVAPHMRTKGYGRIVNLASRAGQLAQMGQGFPAYRMSKSAVNALTRTAAAELSRDGIKVNAMCPGWVKTAMGGPEAPRTVAEGADTAVWLAMLEDDGPTGGFFGDRLPIPW